jgi:succinate dehydrogenase / fumarate reductase cytochrome b subunit
MQENIERSGQSRNRPSFRTFLFTASSYRKLAGMLAWLLHRFTGLALVAYLVLHIMGLRSLADPAAFEVYVTTYRNPLFKIAEAILLGSVAFHAFNGVRIMIQDAFYRSERQRQLFYGVLVLTFVVTLVGGLSIIFPYFIAPMFP